MIVEPLNDTQCLHLLHEEARRRSRHPVYVELANAFDSPAEIAAFIRTRPQELDLGSPLDGPRIACIPSQRLRPLSNGLNCFEASCMYLSLAECIDPSTPRTSCTIRVDSGYHTFPVERGHAVILDPDPPPRNAIDAGVYECERRNGLRPSLIEAGQSHPWLIRVAANAAQSPCERQAVRNAVTALNRSIYSGRPVDDLHAVARTIALAETEAGLWGDDGLDALDHASHGLRNLLQRIDLGSFKGLAKRIGKRALEAYIISQTGPVGMVLMQELDRHGSEGAQAKEPPAPPRPSSKAPAHKATVNPLESMRLH